MKPRFLAKLAACLSLSLAASLLSAKSQSYLFNSGHASVAFEIKHWHIISKTGNFKKFQGHIFYDDRHLEKSRVDVDIDVASIDTSNELRDIHLRNSDFFYVEKYPTATFRSSKVSAGQEAGKLSIEGVLTLRGVARTVVLQTTITGLLVDDDSGTKRLGFEATTRINRKDFGIAWNKRNRSGNFMIDDEVEINISGATVKNNQAEPDPLLLPVIPILKKLVAGKPDATCQLNGLGQSKVSGSVTFTQEVDGILVEGEFNGLSPGKHGIHIHQHGDCSGEAGDAAGSHFNPMLRQHGMPAAFESHDGDLGNLLADAKGHARFSLRSRWLKLSGETGILGRSIIVHAKGDDLSSQPAGNSGIRLACGQISASLR